MGRHTGAEKAELLLEAARYLNETLELERVYDRFDELLTDAVPHGGVIVSSFDAATGVIRCDYALVDGEKLDPAILPPLELNREGGGMQSRVIVSGEPLVVNDVPEQVKDPSGVYYDVNKEGQMRKLPEEGPPGVQSAMMLPVKHEGEVVGVVQLMHEHFRYEQEHLELAEGLVGLMAAAVRNARLHRQSQAEAAARARAEATAAEREHAARVLEAVGDGIFLLDDGVVRLWNRAAELVTGCDRENVLGRPIADVFSGWEALAREIPVSAGWAPARSVTLPVELNGRELWLSFSGVRSLAGVVYAFRDLTIERKLEEAKSDFVASVSHELRTPMTAVLGAAQTLLRDDIELSPDRRRQLLEMIGSQGRRLTQVTDDVLLASRLDRGDELRFEREPVDLAEPRPNGCRDDARAAARVGHAAGRPRRRGHRGRRPGPDRAGAAEPDRQRRQVLAGRRRGDGLDGAGRGPGTGRGRGRRARDPARRARLGLREVLSRPLGRGADRHWARSLHLPGARPPDGRHDRRPLAPGRRLDVLLRASVRHLVEHQGHVARVC